MEDAVLKRGTGQAPVHSGSSNGLELLREGGGPALEPGVRVERHGEARAGPNGCHGREGRLNLAIASAVRQPDVAGPQGIAEFEQDRSFPELAIEAAIPPHAFQPFRPHEGNRHRSHQGSVTRAVKGAQNVDCTEERRRGLAAAEGQTVQEAGSISAEASISVGNKVQRISHDLAGQSCSLFDQLLECLPATARLERGRQTRFVVTGGKDSRTDTREGFQRIADGGSSLAQMLFSPALASPIELADDP